MSVPVLPIVDLQTGQVQFRTGGNWQVRYVPEPRKLSALLGKCARHPEFDAEHDQLMLPLPARGRRGIPTALSLAKFPCALPAVKIDS